MTLAAIEASYPPINEVETLVRAMYAKHQPGRVTNKRNLTFLRNVCQRLESVDRVRHLTDEEIQSLNKTRWVRTMLYQLRGFATGQPRGKGNHKPRNVVDVPVDVLRLNPELSPSGGWPAYVADFMMNVACDPRDIDYLCCWLRTFIASHLARHPDRESERVVKQFSSTMLRIFRLMHAAKGDATPFRKFLPLSCDASCLTAAFAKMFIRWAQDNKTASVRGRHSNNVLRSDVIRCTMHCVCSAIKSGVFPNISPASTGFNIHNILRNMKQLAAENPVEWTFPADDAESEKRDRDQRSGRLPRHGTKGIDPITKEEADVLLQRATAPWDRALVALLLQAAPRNAEIANIRIGDVWDGERIRDQFNVIQKGSRPRTILVRPTLRDALAALVDDHMQPAVATAFLFDVHRPHWSQPPSLSTITHRFFEFCDRIGLRRIRLHCFRAFLVNYGMQNGASMTQVSAAIGHSCISTTARYYWTDDVGRQVANVLDLMDEDTVESLRARLTAVRNEIDSLRCQLSAKDIASTKEVRTVRFMPVVDDTPGGIDVDGLFSSLASGT